MTFEKMTDAKAQPVLTERESSQVLYERVVRLADEIARDEEFIKRHLVELLDQHRVAQARSLLVSWLTNPPRAIVAKLKEDVIGEEHK